MSSVEACGKVSRRVGVNEGAAPLSLELSQVRHTAPQRRALAAATTQLPALVLADKLPFSTSLSKALRLKNRACSEIMACTHVNALGKCPAFTSPRCSIHIV